MWNTGRSGFDTVVVTDRSKTKLAMMYDGGAVLPSSDSGSRPGGTSAADSSQQQWRRLVPKEPLPPPMTPRLRPERRQTEGQFQSLRREVEHLRVEMDAMRAGQQLQHQPRMTEEPPPGYVES